MSLFKEHKGFDEPAFRETVFGVGRYPDAWWQWRPGWTSWRDVREYFGTSELQTNEQHLREGNMSDELYQHLANKIGEERLKKFFPAEPSAPKKSKADEEIDELVTLMCGSINDINSKQNKR